MRLRRFIRGRHDTRCIFFTFAISLISFDQIADNNVKMTDFLLGRVAPKTFPLYLCFVDHWPQQHDLETNS